MLYPLPVGVACSSGGTDRERRGRGRSCPLNISSRDWFSSVTARHGHFNFIWMIPVGTQRPWRNTLLTVCWHKEVIVSNSTPSGRLWARAHEKADLPVIAETMDGTCIGFDLSDYFVKVSGKELGLHTETNQVTKRNLGTRGNISDAGWGRHLRRPSFLFWLTGRKCVLSVAKSRQGKWSLTLLLRDTDKAGRGGPTHSRCARTRWLKLACSM